LVDKATTSHGTVATAVLFVLDFQRAWCHGLVAVSLYDPAGQASSRIRGATVLPRTTRVVDRGVIDGSAVADLRPPSSSSDITLVMPPGGAEPGTRLCAVAGGAVVDPGTLADRDDRCCQWRRRWRFVAHRSRLRPSIAWSQRPTSSSTSTI
jgi:hypothetical protein